MPDVKRLSLYRRFNRWLRKQMLENKDEGPITFGQRIADFIRVFILVLGIGAAGILFYFGGASLIALSIALFGYRPIGALATTVNVLYWAIQIPLCFFLLVILMVLAMWRQRSESWFVANLLVSTLAVFGLAFALHWYVLASPMNRWRHLNTWPKELELKSFQVCAIEVNELSSKTTAPKGRVTFEILNSSPVAVRKAMFTIHVGDQWYHLSAEEIAPQERKRVQQELDFGVIERELSGDLSGWASHGAELWWDAVRSEYRFDTLTRRPEVADQPIGDCPRIDVSGVWKGDDGTDITLSQRGVHPRGYVRGGGLPAGSTISGTLDGTAFHGSMSEGSGIFELTLMPNGRLEGKWSLSKPSLKDRKGVWSVKKIGPGPIAARRH